METLAELLQKPEYEFSLTKAMLVLAKENTLNENNNFNVEEYYNKLKEIAVELESRIKNKEFKEVISSANTYFFKEKGFRYNDNFLLNKVIDEKKGSCLGLSCIYLAVAELLNLPVYGVIVPKHMFVRWDNNKIKINAETTHKGANIPDESYKSRYIKDIPQKDVEFLEHIYLRSFNQENNKKDIWLRNLSKKEVISVILNDINCYNYIIKYIKC